MISDYNGLVGNYTLVRYNIGTTSIFEIYLLFSIGYLEFHLLKLSRRIVGYVGNAKRYPSPVVNLQGCPWGGIVHDLLFDVSMAQ